MYTIYIYMCVYYVYVYIHIICMLLYYILWAMVLLARVTIYGCHRTWPKTFSNNSDQAYFTTNIFLNNPYFFHLPFVGIAFSNSAWEQTMSHCSKSSSGDGSSTHGPQTIFRVELFLIRTCVSLCESFSIFPNFPN